MTLHLSGDKLVDSMSDTSIMKLVIYLNFSCIRLSVAMHDLHIFVSGECVGLLIVSVQNNVVIMG